MSAKSPQFNRRSLLRAGGVAGAGSLFGLPLLSACGSDDNSSGGGPLVLGTAEIMQFDPYQTNSSNHIHTFYTNLISYAEGGYEPIPWGAESWEFADDFMSVEIVLRELTFHNGSPVTADDLVAGIQRAQDPEDAYTQIYPSSYIETATAVDDRTVRLEYVRPTPNEFVLDWMYAFPLVSADSNSSAALENEPAGSGPFMLESFQRDQRLVMVKNPNYWEQDKPYLDEVEIRFFRDEEALVSGLEAGDLHGVLYLALRNEQRLRDRYTITQSPGKMDLFFMNGSRPPFDNKMLRQALARAVNRDRIIEQVHFGMGEPVYVPLMPVSPAFDPSYLDSHGFDLEAAEALLNQSGGPKSAVAGVGDEPGAVQILQAIQADLREIGFELEIEPMEQTAFLDALFSSSLECCVAAQPNNMQSPALLARGRQMLPTTDNVLMGENIPDAYVDAIAAAETATTPDAQAAAYQAINEVLVDEAWAVGICTRQSLAAMRDDVTGFVVSPRDNYNLTDTRWA